MTEAAKWDGVPPNPERDAYYLVDAAGSRKLVKWFSGSRKWKRMGRAGGLSPETVSETWQLIEEVKVPA